MVKHRGAWTSGAWGSFTGCLALGVALSSCGAGSTAEESISASGSVGPPTTRQMPHGGVIEASTGVVEWRANVCDEPPCEMEGFGMEITVTSEGGEAAADLVVPLPELTEPPTTTEWVRGGGGDGIYWSVWSLAPDVSLEVRHVDGQLETMGAGASGYVPLVTTEPGQVSEIVAVQPDGTRVVACGGVASCGHLDIADSDPIGQP